MFSFELILEHIDIYLINSSYSCWITFIFLIKDQIFWFIIIYILHCHKQRMFINNFLDALPLKMLAYFGSETAYRQNTWHFLSAHRLLQAFCLLSFFLSFLSELKSRAAWSRPRSSLIFSQPYKSPYLSITWQGEKTGLHSSQANCVCSVW